MHMFYSAYVSDRKYTALKKLDPGNSLPEALWLKRSLNHTSWGEKFLPLLHPVGLHHNLGQPWPYGIVTTATTPGRRAQTNHKRHRPAHCHFFWVVHEGIFLLPPGFELVPPSTGELTITSQDCCLQPLWLHLNMKLYYHILLCTWSQNFSFHPINQVLYFSIVLIIYILAS